MLHDRRNVKEPSSVEEVDRGAEELVSNMHLNRLLGFEVPSPPRPKGGSNWSGWCETATRRISIPRNAPCFTRWASPHSYNSTLSHGREPKSLRLSSGEIAPFWIVGDIQTQNVHSTWEVMLEMLEFMLQIVLPSSSCKEVEKVHVILAHGPRNRGRRKKFGGVGLRREWLSYVGLLWASRHRFGERALDPKGLLGRIVFRSARFAIFLSLSKHQLLECFDLSWRPQRMRA